MKNLIIGLLLLNTTLMNGQMSLADSLQSLPCMEAQTQLEMDECSALQL